MISADDYEKELIPMIYNWVEQLSIPRFFFHMASIFHWFPWLIVMSTHHQPISIANKINDHGNEKWN